MPIYISNDLYLGAIEAGGVPNRPLIGWHSVFNSSGVSTDFSSDPDQFPVQAVWSADTYTGYTTSSITTPAPGGEIVFSNAEGGAVDYMGIYGHNMGSAGGISYKIQWSNDGSSWTDITAAKVPANDYPIMEYFNSVTANFFRLLFTVNLVPDSVSITHVKLGRILQLERPRYVGDIPGGLDLKVEKIGSKSYSGQHLGSVLVSEGDSFNITQENNSSTFCRSSDLQRFFRHAIQLEKLSNGPVESFFYAWRPDEYPGEVQYCGQTMSFNPPTNQRSNGMMQWSMQGDAFKRKIF
jgi:hypothetical protein